MTFNKKIDRLESGTATPKSPNDEVVWIDTNNNTISRYDEGSSEWISVGGSEAGTFDDPILKDNVRFINNSNSVRLKVEHGGTGVVRLHAPEDDFALRSAKDILLYAGDDGPGNVYIGWGDATITPNATNRVATIGDIISPPFIPDTTLSGAFVSGYSGSDNQKWGIYLPDHTLNIGDMFRISEVPVTEGIDINGEYLVDYADGDSFSSAEFDSVFGDLSGAFASSWSTPFNIEVDIRPSTTGDITFNGVQIIGDGTIELLPDATIETDQYLVIEPTGPNHIHVRSGGTIDNSAADLYVGGERANVVVSDYNRYVGISAPVLESTYTFMNQNESSSTQFITDNSTAIVLGSIVNVMGVNHVVDSVTDNQPSEGLQTATATGAVFQTGTTYTFYDVSPTDTYNWYFNSNGYLSGPAMGGLFVSGILNGDNDLWLSSGSNVVISSGEGMGVFLENQDDPDNQVATLGDISGATGTFETPDSKLVTVTNGIITSIDPLT
jgi:hypothetical protein